VAGEEGMSMKTMTATDARKRFGELLESVQREPVAITQQGRAVAVLLSPKDVERLTIFRERRERAVTRFDTYFAEADITLSDAARALSDVDIERLVDESR
jgi:antitoxin Phd